MFSRFGLLRPALFTLRCRYNLTNVMIRYYNNIHHHSPFTARIIMRESLTRLQEISTPGAGKQGQALVR